MTSVWLFDLLRVSISVCSKLKYLQYFSVKRWSSHTRRHIHTHSHTEGGKARCGFTNSPSIFPVHAALYNHASQKLSNAS